MIEVALVKPSTAPGRKEPARESRWILWMGSVVLVILMFVVVRRVSNHFADSQWQQQQLGVQGVIFSQRLIAQRRRCQSWAAGMLLDPLQLNDGDVVLCHWWQTMVLSVASPEGRSPTPSAGWLRKSIAIRFAMLENVRHGLNSHVMSDQRRRFWYEI